MSLHKLYCAVCFKEVEVELTGRPHDFMSWPFKCPCKEEEEVVIKQMFGNGGEYGLFNMCDLEPTIDILQRVLKKQGKPLMEFVG